MHGLVALLGVLILLTSAATAAAPGESWRPAAVDHVDTSLNVLIFTDAADQRYVRHIDVTQLDLPTSGGPRHKHAGEWYFRADDLPRHEVHVDEIGNRVHFVRRARPHVEKPPSEHLLLDVTVNGRQLDEPLLMHYAHGEIVLSESALAALGINEEKARLLLKQEDNLPLHAVAGERFAMDYAALTLVMTVPPSLFEPMRIDVSPDIPAVAPTPGLSAMLNYDVTAGTDPDGEQWQAGLFELSVGGATSVCTTQHVRLRDVDELRRLDSRCTFDWPRNLVSLNVGDAVTRAGSFGQAVRYGGVRVGTDFGLAPALATQPSLALLGSARVPSTLEVWVDETLALRREVQPGAFELNDIPAHTGAGELRATVTNALGVREIVSHSFYSDPALLAPGLADWSVELGRQRRDYVLENDRYADRFALFDLRYGWTDWLTVESRVEATDDFRVAGLGAVLRAGNLGVIGLSRSVSRTDEDVDGAAAEIAFSRRGRYFSLNLRHARSDETFVQLGYPEPATTPAQRSQASVGFRIPGGVSLSVGGFERQAHDGTRQQFRTAALNFRLGRFGHLILSAFDPVEPAGDPTFSAHVTIPFGTRSNLSASGFRQGETEGRQLMLQRNLPSGPGIGYRLDTAEINDSRTDHIEVAAQGDIARLRLDARRFGEATAEQAQLTGSVLASRNGVHLTRSREGSAAVVQLPAGDIRVYHDERLAAVANGGGTAVIPGLRPYQANRLRIEIDDLPMDAQIRESDIYVTPGRRQTIAAHFSVTRSRHVSARLRLAGDGAAVPSGATVAMANDKTFPVGYDGFVYLPIESQERLALDVRWPGGHCRADISLPESSESFVDAGAVQCRE